MSSRYRTFPWMGRGAVWLTEIALALLVTSVTATTPGRTQEAPGEAAEIAEVPPVARRFPPEPSMAIRVLMLDLDSRTGVDMEEVVFLLKESMTEVELEITRVADVDALWDRLKEARQLGEPPYLVLLRGMVRVKEREGERGRLVLHVVYPATHAEVHRRLRFHPDGRELTRIVANVFARILRTDLETMREQAGKPPPEDAIYDQLFSDTWLGPDREMVVDPLWTSKLETQLGAILHYDPSGVFYQAGMSADLTYYPFPSLGVHLGTAYLHDLKLRHDNDQPEGPDVWNFRFNQIPLWLGLRYYFLHEDVDVFVEAEFSVQFTRLYIEDLDQPKEVNRANLGLGLGAGTNIYVWKGLYFFSHLYATFTPRTQAYYIYDTRVFELYPASIQVKLGFGYDFLK